MAVGDTEAFPEVASALPEIEGVITSEVAFVLVQVRVTLWPELMVVELALKVTVGAGDWVLVVLEEPPHATKAINNAVQAKSENEREKRLATTGLLQIGRVLAC